MVFYNIMYVYNVYNNNNVCIIKIIFIMYVYNAMVFYIMQ